MEFYYNRLAQIRTEMMRQASRAASFAGDPSPVIIRAKRNAERRCRQLVQQASDILRVIDELESDNHTTPIPF